MYLTRRFYLISTVIILIIAGGYFLPPLYAAGRWLLALFCIAVAAETAMLWSRKGITAWRSCAARFSNDDDNEVSLRVESSYPFGVRLGVTDEIPFVFQRRDIDFRLELRAREGKTVSYMLRPTRRGVCGFGHIRVFVSTSAGCVCRRFTCGKPEDVKVYPSFLMLHRYELLAISNRLSDMGVKKIRRVGHNTEFEQIRDYVEGDDYRTINWRATARRSRLMVNVYQDERSQQMFSVIDKGRVMQHAFRGMTLLDYAINASLVLSYVAIRKQDKAGLITFNEKSDTCIPASARSGQMQRLLECLYSQETTFGETDYSELVASINMNVSKRSLLVLYTNFSGKASMERCLPYLRQLNSRHRLLVVFFEDRELKDYIASKPTDTEDYYCHVIAEKFAGEQRLIVSLLRQNGIMSLLTTPENLSVDVINKYLDMKSRHAVW